MSGFRCQSSRRPQSSQVNREIRTMGAFLVMTAVTYKGIVKRVWQRLVLASRCSSSGAVAKSIAAAGSRFFRDDSKVNPPLMDMHVLNFIAFILTPET